jgi:hypothetical protein
MRETSVPRGSSCDQIAGAGVRVALRCDKDRLFADAAAISTEFVCGALQVSRTLLHVAMHE